MMDYKTTVLIKELELSENILFDFYYNGEKIDAESSLFKFRKLSIEQWSPLLLETLKNDCNFDLFEIYFHGHLFNFKTLQTKIEQEDKCNIQYVEKLEQQDVPEWIVELCYPRTENEPIEDVKTDVPSDKTICLDTEEAEADETPLANENSCHKDFQGLINDNGNNNVVHDANADKSDELKQLLKNHPLDKFVSTQCLFDEDLRDFLKSLYSTENNFSGAAIIAILKNENGIQNSVKYRIAIAPLDSDDDLSEVYFIKTLVIEPDWLQIFDSDNYIVLRYNGDIE